MTKTALQVLASNLKVIKNAKAKYEETIQDSIEVFLNNYETALSRNSKPLQDLLNAVASKDVGIIKWYLSKCTNIKQPLTPLVPALQQPINSLPLSFNSLLPRSVIVCQKSADCLSEVC